MRAAVCGDGRRLLSEPTVLECLEVEWCVAGKKQNAAAQVSASETSWPLPCVRCEVTDKTPGRQRVCCSLPVFGCACGYVPCSWHRVALKVTAAGGVRRVCCGSF